MNEIDKFRADARRAIKHERAENGKNYDGMRAARQIALFFCKASPSLGGLPESISDYWLEEIVSSCPNPEDVPTEPQLDWLAAALSFLQGDVEDCLCFSNADWKKIGELVNYEAEDLPIEELSMLMGILLEKQAL